MILNPLRTSFRIKLTNYPTANLPPHAPRATFKGTCDGVKSGPTARKLATNSLYSQKTLMSWMKLVVFGLRFAVSKIIDVTTTKGTTMKPRDDEYLNSPLLFAVTKDGMEHYFRYFLDSNNVLYFSVSSLYDSILRPFCFVDKGALTREEQFWHMSDDEYDAMKKEASNRFVVDWFTNCCSLTPPKGYLSNPSEPERKFGEFLRTYCADSEFTFHGYADDRGHYYRFSVKLTENAVTAFRKL